MTRKLPKKRPKKRGWGHKAKSKSVSKTGFKLPLKNKSHSSHPFINDIENPFSKAKIDDLKPKIVWTFNTMSNNMPHLEAYKTVAEIYGVSWRFVQKVCLQFRNEKEFNESTRGHHSKNRTCPMKSKQFR